jgi:hypothetical protein
MPTRDVAGDVWLSEGDTQYPPYAFGFVSGSRGGPMRRARQIPFQMGVGMRGAWRTFQKTLWVADPFTGVLVPISDPFQSPAQVWEADGGTSVSYSMYSALWTIANEEAGVALDQAAP